MFHLSYTEKTGLFPLIEFDQKVYVAPKIGAAFQLRAEQREAANVMLHAEFGYGFCCFF